MKKVKRKKINEHKPKRIAKKESMLPRFTRVVSTGSTLLDLAISGGRIPGGGIPSGILVEIYGQEGSGKTAVLAEICASAQSKKGEVRFRDPEGRLDKEYATIYGVNIEKDFFDYKRPDTVKQLFKDLKDWEPESDSINIFCADSVAAISTEMEMEDEDKRGQKQAKEFSQNLRKSGRMLARENLLTVFTNQVREGEHGEITPGGKAIRFYASLRIRTSQTEMIIKKKKLKSSGVEIKKTIGIVTTCYIKKSTIDNPYRMCDIYILFGYGIDDIRGNLQYIKDMTKDSMYNCFGKRFHGVDLAIEYIEKNELQDKLKQLVIETWESIDKEFEMKRESKLR